MCRGRRRVLGGGVWTEVGRHRQGFAGFSRGRSVLRGVARCRDASRASAGVGGAVAMIGLSPINAALQL